MTKAIQLEDGAFHRHILPELLAVLQGRLQVGQPADDWRHYFHCPGGIGFHHRRQDKGTGHFLHHRLGEDQS